jgi:hypothetical protein
MFADFPVFAFFVSIFNMKRDFSSKELESGLCAGCVAVGPNHLLPASTPTTHQSLHTRFQSQAHSTLEIAILTVD